MRARREYIIKRVHLSFKRIQTFGWQMFGQWTLYCLQQKKTKPFIVILLTQSHNTAVYLKLYYNIIITFNNLSYIVSNKKNVFAIHLSIITSLALSLTGLNTETHKKKLFYSL